MEIGKDGFVTGIELLSIWHGELRGGVKGHSQLLCLTVCEEIAHGGGVVIMRGSEWWRLIMDAGAGSGCGGRSGQ